MAQQKKPACESAAPKNEPPVERSSRRISTIELRKLPQPITVPELRRLEAAGLLSPVWTTKQSGFVYEDDLREFLKSGCAGHAADAGMEEELTKAEEDAVSQGVRNLSFALGLADLIVATFPRSEGEAGEEVDL